ncbi:MAG: gamma carbonic anhydrase family protein [Promethearchaeota archaeon]|nr:MAG: gamma carbonic anhydrase family protein [Candidatus Lokiarchaeota archaeon]
MIIKSPFNGTIPKIHPTTFIASDVVIIGDVEIGAYTNIWFGVKLRGDWGKIVIGENTSIQENVVVHSRPNELCKIGNNVRLAHLCMCHGPCIIEDYSLVGINASVLQGGKLGKGSTLAAGSVLREETEDFCLYAGVPAIKKKEYSKNRLNEFSTNLYVENGQKFKKAGYSQKVPSEYLIS